MQKLIKRTTLKVKLKNNYKQSIQHLGVPPLDSLFWSISRKILLINRRGALRRGVLRHPGWVSRLVIARGRRGALHSM